MAVREPDHIRTAVTCSLEIGGEVVGMMRIHDRPNDCATVGLNGNAGMLFELPSERIIGGHEEPALQPLARQRDARSGAEADSAISILYTPPSTAMARPGWLTHGKRDDATAVSRPFVSGRRARYK